MFRKDPVQTRDSVKMSDMPIDSSTSLESPRPYNAPATELPQHQNKFMRGYNKVAKSWFGFNKAYNLPLWIIFAGAMLGFFFARVYYTNVGVNYSVNALPGEWYYFHTGSYRVGITIHLVTILPASFLVVWQFVPIIRKKWILAHRINGYIVITLLLVSIAGVLMISRHAAGGEIATQAGFGLLSIMTVGSTVLAYINVKRLQIEQHRAWMLRTWFYAGSIITLRIIMIIAASVASLDRDYSTTWPCAKIAFLTSPTHALAQYPECASPANKAVFDTGASTLVNATFTNAKGPEQVGAIFNITFPAALWLALFLHAVGVEIYLNLTTAEAERLRVVSYRKQVAAGMKHPGSGGLTADRFGDVAMWEPPREVALECGKA